MNQNSYIGEDQFLKFLGEKSAAEGGDYRGRAYQGFGIPFVQAKKNLSPFSSVTEGIGVLNDQFMSGKLGNFFADANPILGMATGQPINLGDETGSASILPGGGFQLAGKYSSFAVNPFMREVSGSLTNKKGNLTVGGRFGMGPQGSYDPRVELNFQIGGLNQGPVTAPEQMNSPEMPQERINPLTGSKIIIDERGYTRKVPYLSTEGVMPSPYQGPYAR